MRESERGRERERKREREREREEKRERERDGSYPSRLFSSNGLAVFELVLLGCLTVSYTVP